MALTPAKVHAKARTRRWLKPLLLVFWLFLLGLFFANFEIQIEGGSGWAANLPTWRIEKHPLLDLFWCGKPLTGYHLWGFSFMLLVFHLPLVMLGRWSIKLEARVVGSVCVFWIIEDFLWFALNPAFGLGKFNPASVPWHRNWIAGMPADYIVFVCAGAILIWFSYREQKTTPKESGRGTPPSGTRD